MNTRIAGALCEANDAYACTFIQMHNMKVMVAYAVIGIMLVIGVMTAVHMVRSLRG